MAVTIPRSVFRLGGRFYCLWGLGYYITSKLHPIEIARQQQAKLLELRATMSLARLWQQQGKQQEAHAMLSEVYGWFTEGFDTRDLQEAKTLLETLA